MQFLVIAYDGKDEKAHERRLRARPKHLALGDELRDKGRLLYGVAILDDAEKMIGSVLIADFPSQMQLDEWLKVEPYVTEKVWEQIQILPCRVGPSFMKSQGSMVN